MATFPDPSPLHCGLAASEHEALFAPWCSNLPEAIPNLKVTISTEFLFVRHGNSTANVTRTISNRVSDYAPLTELGRSQAKDLLAALHGRRIIAVYSSPLMRAKETAEIVAAEFGLNVKMADALREPYRGEIEGRSDDEAWSVHAAQEAAWRSGRYEHRIPGGESFLDLQARFIPFVERMMAKHSDDGASIILVSHGSLLTNMLPLVLTNVEPDFVRNLPIGNCALIVATRGASGLECVEWCGIETP